MLAVQSHALPHPAFFAIDDDDDAPTLEREVFFGDPCIISHVLRGPEAALAALLELAAADEDKYDDDDEPITREFKRIARHEDNMAWLDEGEEVTLEHKKISFDGPRDNEEFVYDEPIIVFEEIDPSDEGAIDELLAPYVKDRQTLPPATIELAPQLQSPWTKAPTYSWQTEERAEGGWGPATWVLVGGVVFIAEIAASYMYFSM